MLGDDRGPVRARVCCAPFPLLRLLTLHCTRRRGAAEGEGAQQTEKGVADDPAPPRIRHYASRDQRVPAPTRAEPGPRRPGVRRGAPDRGPVIVLTAGSVRVLVPVPVRSFALISRAGVGKSNPATPGASVPACVSASPTCRTPPRRGCRRAARSSGNRRDRHLTREHVPLADVLAGQVTISRTRLGRAGMGRGSRPGRRRHRAGSRPIPGAARTEPGAGRGRHALSPACVMRAQRNTIHPASRRASPARQNPAALDPRRPTSHNAT